ncbi:MAG: TfoX/Sxy family DNA transformation protein [Gammaproteobacteria bacterium]
MGTKNLHFAWAPFPRFSAAAAFVAIKRAGLKPSLNLLWAPEGALTNRGWRQVANDDRLSLPSQADFLESGQGNKGKRPFFRSFF